MKVRSYGRLADLLGPERDLAVDRPCTVAELRALLAGECPSAANQLENKRVRTCVDDMLVDDSFLVSPGQLVELLAPVSGG